MCSTCPSLSLPSEAARIRAPPPTKRAKGDQIEPEAIKDDQIRTPSRHHQPRPYPPSPSSSHLHEESLDRTFR